MNVHAIICQINQLTGTLHHAGMASYNNDDLRSLADSLEQARDVVFAEIRHRMELEREANPPGATPLTIGGGLLDGIGKLDGGAA